MKQHLLVTALTAGTQVGYDDLSIGVIKAAISAQTPRLFMQYMP